MNTHSGVVILDKPSGITSHTAVARLRRVLQTKRIGHAGTLDPMATGVLILGVNRATRLLGYLALHDKRYVATIRLGQTSSTDDAEGELGAIVDTREVSESRLSDAVAHFRGEIEQVPSAVSAVKIAGKRAYQRVRDGEDVELPARCVSITRYDVTDIRREGPYLDVDIDVECSSGTYIRALARDLGESLLVGGHLTRLRRTRVGGFCLDDAVLLGDEPPEMMSMGEVARRCFASMDVDESQLAGIRHGKPLAITVPADPTAMIAPGGDLAALYRPSGRGAVAVAVFAS